MNPKKGNKMNRDTETWKGATLRGALVWGSVYSTATAGSVYLLAPTLTDHVIAYADLFKNALMVFPFAGAFRGAVMWRAKNGYNVFRGGLKKGA